MYTISVHNTFEMYDYLIMKVETEGKITRSVYVSGIKGKMAITK